MVEMELIQRPKISSVSNILMLILMLMFNTDSWCSVFFIGLKMAFVNKIGNMLKQIVSRHANLELCASRTSLYQAIRSMSSSKLFVGGKRILFPVVVAMFFLLLYNCQLLTAGLSWGTDETSLKEAFSQHGEVIEGICLMTLPLLI